MKEPMKQRVLRSGLRCAAIILALLFAASGAAAQTETEAPPGWIADAKTGCKIWNPAPEPGEAVRWSGPCKNGFADGSGTLIWSEKGQPGDRYDGDYRGGKRNGHGIVTYSNGDKIEGQWRDDELLQLPPNEIDFKPRR